MSVSGGGQNNAPSTTDAHSLLVLDRGWSPRSGPGQGWVRLKPLSRAREPLPLRVPARSSPCLPVSPSSLLVSMPVTLGQDRPGPLSPGHLQRPRFRIRSRSQVPVGTCGLRTWPSLWGTASNPRKGRCSSGGPSLGGFCCRGLLHDREVSGFRGPGGSAPCPYSRLFARPILSARLGQIAQQAPARSCAAPAGTGGGLVGTRGALGPREVSFRSAAPFAAERTQAPGRPVSPDRALATPDFTASCPYCASGCGEHSLQTADGLWA